MLSVPASSVRELNDPEAVINFWDLVIESHCTLAGVQLAGRRQNGSSLMNSQVLGTYMMGIQLLPNLMWPSQAMKKLWMQVSSMQNVFT